MVVHCVDILGLRAAMPNETKLSHGSGMRNWLHAAAF
jgi:hypothetical protein